MVLDRGPELVAPGPCGLIASKPKLLLEPGGCHPATSMGVQPEAPEPKPEGLLYGFGDGAHCWGLPVGAPLPCADPLAPALPFQGGTVMASRAFESVWPFLPEEEPPALAFGPERRPKGGGWLGAI